MAEPLGGPVAVWGGARPTLVQAAIDGAWENPIVLSGASETDTWLPCPAPDAAEAQSSW